MYSIFTKAIRPFGFIKPSIIQKLPIKSNISVKLMEFWSCIFGNSRIRFLKISWLDCEQYRKNQYKKKEHNQQLSIQIVMITLILSKCHRSIDNSIEFILFTLSWEGS